MEYLCGYANAKINLTLDVVGRRDDGYHLIKSVMQPISLADEIKIRKTDDDKITIKCSDSMVPCDERNTVYKACVKYFDFTQVSKCGVEIHIDKHIPSEAGLGGGSADAATVIKLLDEMFETNLSLEDMCEIGAGVGADVPFCIVSKTSLCEGMGEVITPLNALKKHYVLLVKPNFGISTPLAYKMFDEKQVASANASDNMVEAISLGNDITKLLANDLERAIDNEEISVIKARLIKCGADGALMTGSGSCVYGLFSDKEVAFTAFETLRDSYPFVYLAETI